MIANQLGRRNLTPAQMAYYRGEQYNLQKRQGKRTDVTSDQNDPKLQSTAARLADQHHVSAPTIKRDGAYARAVDIIAEAVGPAARQALLESGAKVTQHEVKQLADIAQVDPALAHRVLSDVRYAATPHAAKHCVRVAVEAIQEGIAMRGTESYLQRGVPAATLERFVSTLVVPSAAPQSGASDTIPPLVLEAEAPAVEETTAPATWPQTVSTGDYEWYTPPEVLDPVRAVLGEIDLDPASCDAAQARVQARTFYTAHDDGLRQPWHGKVFCNPPYKMPEIARFIGKLFEELDAQRTTAAILLVHSATETDWFQRAFARADAVCFPDGRIHFVSAARNGDHPCQGQALLYFGPQPSRFCAVFAALGVSTLVVYAAAESTQLALAEAPAMVADAAPSPDTAPSRAAVGLQMAVWLVVQQLQPCTNAQVAKALGKPRNATHQVLQALVKQGKARKEGQTYRVVDAPKGQTTAKKEEDPHV
jgi:phage N-6-adenine-methyltransferase